MSKSSIRGSDDATCRDAPAAIGSIPLVFDPAGPGELNPQLGCRVDASDIVQQTLLEAHATQGQCRGTLDVERGAWLRQILAHNLADALRGISRARRDLHRQESLEASVNRSSIRLGDLLAADGSAPGDALDREEARFIWPTRWPTSRGAAKALVMQYWQGMSLAQIAVEMSRTPAAVAGLLKRALKQLRQYLREPASEGAS